MLRIAVATLLLAGFGAAPAQDHRPEDWPEGSAMRVGLEAKRDLAVADKALNASYRALLALLPADASDHHPRKTLVAAQRAWIAYRDASCDLTAELTGAVRMWKSSHAMLCLLEATRQRGRELADMVACQKEGERCPRP